MRKYHREHRALDDAHERDMVDSLRSFINGKLDSLDQALEQHKAVAHASDRDRVGRADCSIGA